jgi:asparagine synthase (glutamine-hydrolysing)
MCGIAGFITLENMPSKSLEGIAKSMADKISYRGPDDFGVWVSSQAGIALSHRRLAIIELSDAGKQPMHSHSGRFIIAFNGEIYNHLELRSNLEKENGFIDWRGTSDTETLLMCFDLWGISSTTKKIDGMFAFAVWDNLSQKLFLARDRLGEKPLYYGWEDSTFIFASELKAIKSNPAFKGVICRDALSLYMRYSCVPAPFSIYKNIYKLRPGNILEASNDSKKLSIESYWSIGATVDARKRQEILSSPNVTVKLDELITNTVGSQMLSDVPIGAFLSGGVDSSLIVAMMQKQSGERVKTFTVGYEDENYSEAKFAKLVSSHLGTEHTEIILNSSECLEVIPKLGEIYDEPFADSSQIPTFLVSHFARQTVKVCLSGDGADELFGGYNRYKYTSSYWAWINSLPLTVRNIIAKGIFQLSPYQWNQLLHKIKFFQKYMIIGERLHKGANALSSRSLEELYTRLSSHWLDADSIVVGNVNTHGFENLVYGEFKNIANIEQMMHQDILNYLPNDILVKVDRASMANSLEVRAPFLDQHIVDFALNLPINYKINNGVTKWLLREILCKYVPKSLTERPKMGFGVPIDSWLRGALKPWAEELLSESRLKRDGYFKVLPIRSMWSEHLSGKRNWQHHLWDVLMFQTWLDNEKI